MSKKVLIVDSNYYPEISFNLVQGATEYLDHHNIKSVVIKAPGAFEIPFLINSKKDFYDGFVALGCVIKGETPHFDFISKTTFDAIMKLSVDHKKPIGNGIITALNIGQAEFRSSSEDLPKGSKFNKPNKGSEAARAVLSILGILKNESK